MVEVPSSNLGSPTKNSIKISHLRVAFFMPVILLQTRAIYRISTKRNLVILHQTPRQYY
jgi:hypothetical protein